ncbi:MAG: alanine--tRNA ligase, partial [Eggerthellaceae bacterium]|nr:alanine--tRNA ligase [Eggerthellaceae bacterium]
NDIEIIGTTGRHQSFFEMLGNFSFGKYFKKEMCAWAYEFSTEVLGLPAEKLYFTVFEDDDETIEIWKSLGIPESHISRLGEDDNFWRAGPTGPCGPCSEIYFDQGPEVGCGSPDCAPGCDCDRFLEYWNCVFTQFDGQEDGTLVPLPKKNIDTGMGLERIAAIMQGVHSNYETDVLRSLISVGEKLANTTYGNDAKQDLALRIIADHSRSVTFMIADGILPSNEGRGYVLRRLLRRAVMKAQLIGIEGTFLNTYVDEIVRLMGSVYPEIVENRELIGRIILSEEERFGATLRQGRDYLEDALAKLKGKVLSGEAAFVLHDTYGFPVEVTKEICAERGVSVDEAGFKVCMEKQRDRARAANAKDSEAAWSTYGGVYSDVLNEVGPTKFVGYDNIKATAKVVALVRGGEQVAKVESTEDPIDVDIIVDTTPFYAEMGGEVGDTGSLTGKHASAQIVDTKAPEKSLHVHKAKVRGVLCVGDEVELVVDEQRRMAITRNHTATHILHASLIKVLGGHVKQAGSYVGPDRLRFDFTHFEGVSPEQLNRVERIANEYIMRGIDTNIYETSLSAARESGVTALFGEKYGEVVRVVEAGEFSRELCGGCHVKNTAQIGLIKIVSEGSVGANMRRIEALTGLGALEYVSSMETELKNAADALHTTMFSVAERSNAVVKQLHDANVAAKKQNAPQESTLRLVEEAKQARGGYPIVITRLDGADSSAMRNAWDIVKAKLPASAVVFVGNNDNTPIILAAGSDEAVAKGFDAGAVIKAIAPAIKGGGGGKSAMAQAGGKDVSGIDEALRLAREALI